MLRTIHPETSALALALVLSTAAHAAVATSPWSRAPGTPVSTLAPLEVDVEPAPDDPPSVTVSDAFQERTSPPMAPATHARRGPSRPHAAAAGPVDSSTAPRSEVTAPPTAPPPLPRFAIAIANSGPAGNAAQDANGRTGPGADAPGEPLPERAVDVPARLQRGETPRYPPDALADAIEGDVQLELVVSRTGDVESAKVIVPAGHRFDEEAIASARRFRFMPALKDGHSVRVRVRWTVAFRLR